MSAVHAVPGIDAARRFGATERLIGAASFAHLRAAHVIVVGIGGVGSWAAEALARSGVGRLTLIDLDHVAESNVNRQVHALTTTLGQAKVLAMQARLQQITDARIDVIDEFVTVANAAQLLDASADCIVEAIDQASVKAAIIALARRRRQAIVVCGAAGARTDPLQLVCTDLAITAGDALLASVRSRLRRDYGYSRNPRRRFGVPAVYSRQQAYQAERQSGLSGLSGTRAGTAVATGPVMDDHAEAGDDESVAGAPLACAGYGSMATVTGAMGFAAASTAMARIDRAARRRALRPTDLAGPLSGPLPTDGPDNVASVESVTDGAGGAAEFEAQSMQIMQGHPANQGAGSARSSAGEA